MSIASLRSSCARAFEIALLLLLVMAAPCAAAVGEVSMVLSKISGTVEVSTAANPDWRPAAEGLTLRPEDKVRTGADSTARVSYPDAELKITPDSTAVLGYTSVRVNIGSLWVRMRKSGRTFEILTPTVAVTIRGTLVRAAAGAGGSIVHLLEGVVDVKVGSRTQTLQPHQQLEAPIGGALAIGRIDGATEARLAAEFAAGKAEGGTVAPAPAPRKGGGGEQGSRVDDVGQRALTAGLQNLERDLDARSTGMGVTGGSEAAMDGVSARGAASAGAGGAVGGAGGGVGGAGASSAAVRALVSRPGGVAPVGGAGAGVGAGGVADVGGVGAVGGVGGVDTGAVGGVGGVDTGAVGGVDAGAGGGDLGGDDGGNGRGRGRGRGRGVGLLRRFIRR